MQNELISKHPYFWDKPARPVIVCLRERERERERELLTYPYSLSVLAEAAKHVSLNSAPSFTRHGRLDYGCRPGFFESRILFEWVNRKGLFKLKVLSCNKGISSRQCKWLETVKHCKIYRAMMKKSLLLFLLLLSLLDSVSPINFDLALYDGMFQPLEEERDSLSSSCSLACIILQVRDFLIPHFEGRYFLWFYNFSQLLPRAKM
jgi:hypothetical protein